MLLAGVLLTGLAGCGGPSREYEVPKSLCGTATDSDALSPLLPAGSKVRARPGPADAEGATCTVEIVRADAERELYTPVLRVRRDAVPDGVDPLSVKKDDLDSRGDPQKVRIGDGGMLADKGALAVKSCPGKGKDTTFALQVDLSTQTPEDVQDRRAALERFVRAQLPGEFEAAGCA